MAIRVIGQIVKADDSDKYYIIDLDDVGGQSKDKLLQDVKKGADFARAGAKEIEQIKQSVQNFQESVNIVNNNINQKINGIHIEDLEGNAYDNITALNFGKGFSIEDEESANAKIVFNPLITVSNGQEPESVKMTGKVLEFPRATLTMRDPDGAKVIVIQPKSQDDNKKTPLIIDNQTSNFSIAGVTKLELPTTEILAKGNGVYALTPYITVGQQRGGIDDVLANRIAVLKPLQLIPKKNGLAVLTLDPAFNAKRDVSLYAYLDQEREVPPKRAGVPFAKLWCDTFAVSAGSMLSIDRDKKMIGIQETDNKDPNVTGGSAFLLTYRLAMRGVAPSDGTVRIYIRENSQLQQPVGYLEDENGMIVGAERTYKAGERLGVLQVTSVVDAKSFDYMRYLIENNLSDSILLGDRTEGVTGYCIQEISGKNKTGLAWLQFLQDTKQDIPFTRHYLGAEHFTIAPFVMNDVVIEEGKAGQAYTLSDGFGISNITDLRIGVQNGAVVVESDGQKEADFTVHKIFNAEDTVLMQGKQETVKLTLENKDSGFILLGMKWTGKPDEYTTNILASRNNGSPVFENNWIEFDRQFISENILTEQTISKTFTVPTDAVNYAYVLIPNSKQNPITLNMKAFEANVDVPFASHIVHRPQLLEDSLRWADDFWEFMQDSQGYAGLRYTVNSDWQSCPIGIKKKGNDVLTLDKSKMIIAGSLAKGGEGAIVFPENGKVTMSCSFLVWNEQNTDNEFTARLVKVAENGAITPIPNGEVSVKIQAKSLGSTVNLKADTFDVSAGDCVGVQVKSNKVDGVFLESTMPNKPLIVTTIEYKRVI